MSSRIGRWSVSLFLGVLLGLLCAFPCFAAGDVRQVNLHIGQTPDTVYLTYSAPDAAQGAFSVTGPEGAAAYTAAPSAGSDVGPAVYSFDYSNMKFVVLNMNSPDTWLAQADLLRREAADAQNTGKWLVVGFYQSLYSGAAHIVDSSAISARKFWPPLLAETGVDVVLQGHDHVYTR